MVNFRVRLLPGCAGTQARDDFEVCARSFAFAGSLQRRIEIGIQGSRCALRQDSDHGVRLALQKNGPAHDVGGGKEGIAPQTIAEDRGLRSSSPIFHSREVAPDRRMNPQYIEVVRRDTASMEKLHMRPCLQIDACRSSAGNSRREGGHVVAQQFPLFPVDLVALIVTAWTGHARVEGSEAFGVRIGQALQQQ